MKNHSWKAFASLCALSFLASLTPANGGPRPSSAPYSPEQVVAFQSAPGPLDNPLKGWCTYITAGAVHQPYSLVYHDASWKELEPEPGKYQFNQWESRVWNDPLARGRYVVFRIYLDYPSKPSGIPDWLLAQGLKTRPYTDYGGGNSPDYDNPQLVAGLERLIAALGKRYDHDPRVAFIQLGTLGYWGEWHTYPHTDWFASEATQKRVVAAYRQAFPDKILMGRTATGVLGQQPWLGYHDDLIPADTLGPEDWQFLPGIKQAGRMENWKVAATGGEMEPGAADKWMGSDYSITQKAIEAVHMTWIGPYNPALDSAASPEFAANSQALVRQIGYQYVLRDLHYSLQSSGKSGTQLSLTLHAENEGVAPFYYPWPVHLVLMNAAQKVIAETDTKTDIRTWLPGPFTLAAAISIPSGPGPYFLGIGIIDPMTKRPAVKFANTLPAAGDWTVLTRLPANRK